jgi:outer membrane lipoprotein carrier protein
MRTALALTLLSAGALLLGPEARAGGSAAPAPAPAAPPGKPAGEAAEVKAGRALARRVQRFYGRSKDLSAAFSQRYTYAALGRIEEKSGTVQVKKPGLVRWEYQAPEKKLLLLDGAAFWQWLPEDNQVTVKRAVQADELSAAFTFLWGKGDLLAEFAPRAVELPPELPAGQGLSLLPLRPGGSVQKLLLAVDARGRVLASVVTDAQGNENRLVFTGAKVDQALPDALFRFEVPKGASVQELP